jgi:hypothetical protein
MTTELVAKTKARQVNWTPLQTEREGDQKYSYQLALPHSRVTLTYTIPRVEYDFITLTFHNAEGAIVDEWRVDAPDEDERSVKHLERDEDADWRLLKALFGEVYRQATGYDRVMSDVQRALAELGVIGKPAR